MNFDKQLLQRFTRSPFWAIMPGAFVTLLTGPSIESRTEMSKTLNNNMGTAPNRVVVIPVQGVLTKDGPAWLGSNYDAITDAAHKAAADPSVKHIVLHVDSPGGEAIGLPETAAALASVAKVKPVTAMVHGMAASAAYWLVSQANNIHLTPSGEVGSVGVRMMHVDISKAMTDAGLNVTEMSGGAFKTEWSPFHPVTDEAKADMQAKLDAVHKDFLDAVSIGRGARASRKMRETRFGEGRMFTAPDALRHGLVDRLQSGREFFRTALSAPREVNALHHSRLKLELARLRVGM